MNITLGAIGEYMPAISELMRENWGETGDSFEFNPDVEGYARLESLGLMFAYFAIHNGKVIGYCTALVSRELHNPGIVSCTSDALFVSKEHRHTTAGGRLILAVEQEAMKRGAMRMNWGARVGSMLHWTLGNRGYKARDIVLTKEF